jgi:SAM-dependent methyltransferase
MQLKLLKRLKWLLFVALSVGSFAIVACTGQPQANVQNQTPSGDTQVQTPAPSVDAQSPTPSQKPPERAPDVVYVPTPDVVVAKMLELAKVKKDDFLYDLGSGDGRIVISAAQKFGTKGVGIELRPELVQQANQNAQAAGVSDRVQFLQQDLFKTDISKATVVTLYLLPNLNLKLRPTLFRVLKPGSRIVSHDFNMGDWKPEQVVQVQGPNRVHTVYYWVIPEKPPANLL